MTNSEARKVIEEMVEDISSKINGLKENLHKLEPAQKMVLKINGKDLSALQTALSWADEVERLGEVVADFYERMRGFEADRDRYKEATSILTDLIHILEARGVILTSFEDEKWAKATELLTPINEPLLKTCKATQDGTLKKALINDSKEKCDICNGKGMYQNDYYEQDMICPKCNGTGTSQKG